MSYHIQHASEGIPWRWDCDTCNPVGNYADTESKDPSDTYTI